MVSSPRFHIMWDKTKEKQYHRGLGVSHEHLFPKTIDIQKYFYSLYQSMFSLGAPDTEINRTLSDDST